MSLTKAWAGPHNEFGHPDTAMRHADGSDRFGPAAGPRHSRWVLRHVVEMVVAMMIGMFVGVGIFVAIVGVDFQRQHDVVASCALVPAARSVYRRASGRRVEVLGLRLDRVGRGPLSKEGQREEQP